MNLLDRVKRTRPSPLAPGMLAIVADGQSTAFTVGPGQRVTIGRDPGANIVVDDPNVSANHTQVERRGPGWLVNSLDAANPTWILDATGRTQPIDTELGLRSGELLIGKCQVMLYPPPLVAAPLPQAPATPPAPPTPPAAPPTLPAD